MPTAELVKLNRLTTGGIMFERGVRVPVTRELAETLSESDRFKIHWKDDGGGVKPLDEADLASALSLKKPDTATTAEGAELLDTSDAEVTKTNNKTDLIRLAIDELDVDVEANFDPSGRPALAVLSAAIGEEVTEEEREVALGNPHVRPSPASEEIKDAKVKVGKTISIKKAPKAATPAASSDEDGEDLM